MSNFAPKQITFITRAESQLVISVYQEQNIKILFQPSEIEKIWKLFDNIQLWRKFCADFHIYVDKQVFAELDDLTLAKSRETNRSWLHFICNKRFYKIKINEMLENTATDYGKLHGQKSRSKVHCPLIVMDTYFRGFIREKSGK